MWCGFKIGDGIVLNAIECSINPAEYGDKILLGMSALKHLDVQIRQGKMILRRRSSLSDRARNSPVI